MNPVPSRIGQELESLCARIGNEASDDSGFVAVSELLKRFQMQLVSRPLLVEAMLATREASSCNSTETKWVVMIDSETHRINDALVEAESSEQPLPVRARNTIAHELTHSLAFRAADFGLSISSKDERAGSLVSLIEREVERLSPLLLISDKALNDLLCGNPDYMTVATLSRFRHRLGVSREVFISRLQMLRANDDRGLLARRALRNIAVGVVEWTSTGSVFRSWPLFLSFDRNIVPDFLLRIRKQDRMRAEDLFIPNHSLLCGGKSEAIEFECDARAMGAMNSEPMKIVLEVEPYRKSSGLSIFVIRKVDSDDGA